MKTVNLFGTLLLLLTLTACNQQTEFGDIEQTSTTENLFDGDLPANDEAIEEVAEQAQEEPAAEVAEEAKEEPAAEVAEEAKEEPAAPTTTTSTTQQEDEVTVTTTVSETPNTVTTTVVEYSEEQEEEKVVENTFCSNLRYAVDHENRDEFACGNKGKSANKSFLLCHHTSSAKNPVTYIPVSESALKNAHQDDYIVPCDLIDEMPKGSKLSDFSCDCE